ncbi:phenylalanine--tRNA ligase subunit beta [Canibacter sp. lx-45]|uniref:phenylalanine--tRNA ligase subunit beta n=1 Tax=Canibacter zhuwentaonis TaxID=2837491 RepID=UPI001BDD5D2D|nr:phenylalanine--tRNA ligase subunit beta [Canibacter zhuwentaonis]MBT1034963.1 phenylalanine--tRNA ligase subunit beta [Canibacter zhuwentaonis]
MRIPLSWLNEQTPLVAADLKSVHAALVQVGFEEEATHSFEISGPVVVGEVLSREPEEHSNGKTINWCRVRVAQPGALAADGGAHERGIVCGAHNFDVGDRVVVALPGAVLPGGFVIAARKTYGHVSDGMLAAASELGLGDVGSGIIVLQQLGLKAEIGTDALELLGLRDSAVEINVTPDRGYAFSVRGVAREYSHATGAQYTDPAIALTERARVVQAQGLEVELADQAPIRGRRAVSGFITRLLTKVRADTPTPQLILSRLVLAGQRSTGIVSDLANYVMLELGNPLHTYDAAKIDGKITVRRAVAGEELLTLDGVTRKLHPEDLVIADNSGVIGLAGVMGGERTKVTAATTEVLIEAANFDPVSVARTARRHKLPSEAAKRFERGVDPFVAEAAAQRMAELLVTHAGATLTETGSKDVAEFKLREILLQPGYIANLIGISYSEEQIIESLRLIGCDTRESAVGLVVTPPSWRSDLSRPADLAEEVVRITGYEHIPAILPVAPPGRGLTRAQKLRRTVARTVTAFGLTEVQCYPFVSAKQLAVFDETPLTAAISVTKPGVAVKLGNPLDGQTPFLRKSLLPGLVLAAQRNNSRGLTNLALAEFGSVFLPAGEVVLPPTPPLAARPDEAVLNAIKEAIPAQPVHAAGLFTGSAETQGVWQQEREYDWRDALDAARAAVSAVGAQLTVTQGTHPAFHPGRTAVLSVSGEHIGFAGELLPELVAASHLPHRVSVFELDLSLLIKLAPRAVTTAQLSTYPAATQDLTLQVAEHTPSSVVEEAVAEGAGELLENIRLVADYRGAVAQTGKKALTFSLRFRAADRTLEAKEASAAKMEGVARAHEVTGATL